ncbi:ATP-binding protein [Luteimonas sp. BDR2-5]|uniref:ATP-binding protein n=1 Tax=Proluteimonas luteida TaxID=2878685 RepID=UPI001E4BAA27|nr:ATP-binding protein [Luteimonas sp. BDR2-5]MCD9026752.1 ATP-binding protein [Luteimonas sp. BDR2-5]
MSELLQNARRAGASRAVVDYDPATRVLRVEDDGCGVKDFQSLFELHESGWDASLREQEHPFGVGFSKCLYAATRCIVRSGEHFMDFMTATALARTPLDVHRDSRDPIAGTHVELHGVELPDLDYRMSRLCVGFPIPVVFNGKELERPHAPEALSTIPTTIGDVHLAGTASGNYSPNTLVFLQGFKVLGPSLYGPGHVNVVHLDPAKFMARLPDRDQLIDECEQAKLVCKEIRHQWRAILEVAKHRLPPREFVDRFYGPMREFDHLDLLNDLDVLPRGAFASLTGYPILSDHDEILDDHVDPPDRQNIENGRVLLADLDYLDDTTVAQWMYARAKGFLVYMHRTLHPDHWVHASIRSLCGETPIVEPVGEPLHSRFDGIWVSTDLILCFAVRLQIGDEAADIGDEAVYHRGTLFVPANETTGEGVRQASRYIDDNERFREYELDADRDELAGVILRLRSTDPAHTLRSLMQTLALGRYPILHGKSFRLAVEAGETAPSIELVE